MTRPNPETAYAALRSRLQRLRLLNPDLSETELNEIYRLAGEAGGKHVAQVCHLTEELIERYLESPQKTMAAMVLEEFFDYIQASARLLVAEGEIRQPNPPETDREEEPPSMALVLRTGFSSLDSCRVLNRARVPRELVKAVDACRRRNELVGSVIEYSLKTAQLMDLEAAGQWQLDYLRRHRKELDPDIVRDFLNAWLGRESSRPEMLAWAEEWSADEDLLEQWPEVIRKADRLLFLHALKAWQRSFPARNSSLAHLSLLIRRKKLGDDPVLTWLNAALIDIGESVRTFMGLDRTRTGQNENGEKQWRSAAMLKEITRIESLFTPLMLAANLILSVPNGAYRFAVAFFGLVGKGREEWEQRLLQLAETAVRRMFLRGLKERRKPIEIIRKLTFGDETALARLRGELDWTTESFDSLEQREKVTRHLAFFYASYREPKLLAAEVAQRYRNLMRLMHEDNLRRVLLPEHFEILREADIIRDLSAVAGDARRFLGRRRALETDLEEMVAAEMDFVRGIRRLRLRIVHQLLSEQRGEAQPPGAR